MFDDITIKSAACCSRCSEQILDCSDQQQGFRLSVGKQFRWRVSMSGSMQLREVLQEKEHSSMPQYTNKLNIREEIEISWDSWIRRMFYKM